MLFGILSRCDFLTEICEGLRAIGGKLNHLGLNSAPAKITSQKQYNSRPYARCDEALNMISTPYLRHT